MDWQMRAIRGATTVSANTVEAIREAVTELLDELEYRNKLHPKDIISVTFSVTRDLDAIFPAAIARARPDWDNVAMLDVQQMHVEGSLQRCIRFLIHVYQPATAPIYHTYLRHAAKLRPDWSFPQQLQVLEQKAHDYVGESGSHIRHSGVGTGSFVKSGNPPTELPS